MQSALRGVAAAIWMMPSLTGGETSPRRLQTDPNDYSSIVCTTDQPDDAFYCNSLQGMEQSLCTCGSCDQNKQAVPELSLPVGIGSAACGGLCDPKSQTQLDQMSTEQRTQRASLCVFPTDGVDEDGTCKKYSCQHYSKSDCAGMQQMLFLMEPGATPADHFECETLTCVSCPYSQVRTILATRRLTVAPPATLCRCTPKRLFAECAQCKTHAQSGCMYDAALDGVCQGIDPSDDSDCAVASTVGMLKQDCEATLRCDGGTIGGMLDAGACESDGGTWLAKRCQTGVQAKYAEWRYAEPSPANDANAALCGYVENPTPSAPLRGKINVDFIPGVTDASMKCICESCYMTATDYTNRNTQGGYKEYCGINVCTADGEVAWGPSQGTEIVIPSATAGRSECDDNANCKTFAEFAELTGASPEVLMAFGAVCGLLVLYCLINIACDKGDSKEYDSDNGDSSDDDGDD